MASGGIPRIVESAAQLTYLGFDPWRFLNCRDPIEMAIYQGVAKEVKRLQDIRDHNLAVNIANQVGRLFKK